MLLSLLKSGKVGRIRIQMIFLSKDKRRRVGLWKQVKIHFYRTIGMSGVDIANKVCVSKSTVYRHIDS